MTTSAGWFAAIGAAAGMAAGQYFDRKPMIGKLSEAAAIGGVVGAIAGFAMARAQQSGALAAGADSSGGAT